MPRRPFTREQVYLLPPSLDEWLPDDHPVRYVAMFVASLPPETWQELGVHPQGDSRGAPAYAPELLLSVWLAGFMTGIRSSRRLEAACRDQISFRWLSGNQTPDHNTLWRFYDRHRAGMQALLRQTVRTAVAAGLVDLALLAVDGTVVGANARRERTLDEAGLLRLLERLELAIADLDARHAGDEQEELARLPQELARAEQLRERVEQALAQVQAEDGPTRVNVSDSDATLRKGRHGWQVGYMAQAASTPLVAPPSPETGAAPDMPDAPGGQLIVAVDVVASNDAARHLLPLVDAAVAAVGWDAGAVLADSAFLSAALVEECQARGQCLVVPEPLPPDRRPYHKEQFRYDPSADTFTCEQGHVLTLRSCFTRRDGTTAWRYRGSAAQCRGCVAFGLCTRDRRQGRSIEVGAHEQALCAHRVWMAGEEAQALVRRRKGIVEPPFGVLKEQQAFRRVLVRGLPKVRAEWTLGATAYNLRVLARQWQAGHLRPPGSVSAAPDTSGVGATPTSFTGVVTGQSRRRRPRQHRARVRRTRMPCARHY